jgi:signal transduction histidine kinase
VAEQNVTFVTGKKVTPAKTNPMLAMHLGSEFVASLRHLRAGLEDSGQGIEPQRLGSIFEPFVTTKPKGSGLGLAICSRIIERHGGQLTASSDGTNGALFKIVLPVQLTAPVPLAPDLQS